MQLVQKRQLISRQRSGDRPPKTPISMYQTPRYHTTKCNYLQYFNTEVLILSSCPAIAGSTRNRKILFLGSREWPVRRADNLTAVSRLPRQCGMFNNSQPYRPPRPVTGIALNQKLSFVNCLRSSQWWVLPSSMWHRIVRQKLLRFPLTLLLFLSGRLYDLIFEPEDGSNTFLRVAIELLPDYTVSYPT
jgi:hypothetical protein